MVDAVTDDPWDAGTPVYKDFGVYGWLFGKVESYDETQQIYTVKWEDGTTAIFPWDSDELDGFAYCAVNYDEYSPGQAVISADGSRSGTITKFEVSIMPTRPENGRQCDNVV
jgi:hypothetical protein